ncbi:hypothetical protein O181_109244 [Austropuccinia psidii MF-1]|uniref:Integrase catalytic domain-containing protein n=1 Tax=Austropuccinia psidii MF-1 TaxID=1389203 RepID=A0A9Q3JXQ0_9BASI|nr:hypothetical protein [Austropuccinia psidii MF-1]
MSSITSLDLGNLFIKKIFSNHGLPSSIVSDRGALFVSSFWTNLCQQLKISRDLATAYHPETDGQAERANQILKQYLRIDPQFDSVYITQDTPAGNLSKKNQSVQQDFNRELEVAINRLKRYADKSKASDLFSILATWYGFLPRTSNQPDTPNKCLKDSWVLFQS